MRRACIDIGSNTTRLLVADCTGSGLKEVHQERVYTRIGIALAREGAIAPDMVAEVVDVVAAQLASAQHHGAVSVRCVATASVRRAANGGELVDALQRVCAGLAVEVLTAEEEARLAFLGASQAMRGWHADGPLAVVDVGGGSSEIVVGDPAGPVTWWVSLPVGSADLAASCLPSDPPADEEIASARRRLRDVLAGIEPPAAARAVAVGGSATSALRLGSPQLDEAAFTTAFAFLTREPAREVGARFGLEPERAHVLPAGLLILQAISRRLGLPLHVGRGGLREGVLLEAEMRGS